MIHKNVLLEKYMPFRISDSLVIEFKIDQLRWLLMSVIRLDKSKEHSELHLSNWIQIFETKLLYTRCNDY
jgi:hypothetical protein